MKKSVRNQIRYDIKIGILSEWKVYLFFFVLFLFLGGSLYWEGKGVQFFRLSIMDYFVKIFAGIIEFQRMDRMSSFYIPKEWMLVQFPFYIYIAKYPKRDWEQRGIQMILRSQSRMWWWLSKCIWLFLSAVCYYVLFYFAIVIIALAGGGNISFQIRDIWEIGIGGISKTEAIRTIFFMPCLCSIAIGILQMLFSFLFSPILALCMTISYQVLSVAVQKSWILGNYTMLIRNREIDVTNGVVSSIGIGLAIAMTLLGIIVGMNYIKRKEFV